MSEQRDEMNLEALARAVDKGADRMREHMDRFEGGIDEQTGEFIPGIKAMFEERVAEEADEILDQYEREEKRAPGEDTRRARALRMVKRKDPQLYAEYHALAGSIATGQRWLSNKRASLSALQTLQKTGRELAGAR